MKAKEMPMTPPKGMPPKGMPMKGYGAKKKAK